MHWGMSTPAALEAVRRHAPLVSCITNAVVTNITANVLLALGAAPAMVDITGEAGPFARVASTLLINLGTPQPEQRDAAREAVAAAADAVSFTLLQEQLHAVLDTLSEREAGVVSMRFGLTDGQPKTLDEIGKVYGVTRERIRQIESKTMSKLRHPSRSQVLRDYLD